MVILAVVCSIPSANPRLLSGVPKNIHQEDIQKMSSKHF